MLLIRSQRTEFPSICSSTCIKQRTKDDKRCPKTLWKCLSVIHQVARAGFPEEPPKNEQAVLIHAEFSDSAGPEKAPFPVFPLL
jgi:hypothetical protein